MNICIFGNQDNSGYRLCKWLREHGHNAHLNIMKKWESIRSLPEKIDTNLEMKNYPEWIHEYDNTILRTIFGSKKFFSYIEKSYDIVIVMGSIGMMNAFHIKHVPMINISTGPSNQGVIKMWDHISLKHKLFWMTVRFFVRKTVRKCTKIFVHYDPEIYSLGKLNQLGKIVFYGSPEDVKNNAKRVDLELLDELNRKYEKYDFVFIWLSRIAFLDQKNPMYKGTDKFIDAAEKIIKEGGNVRLIIGKHGEDYEALVKIINKKGLMDYVDWVEHLPYWQLLTYLSIGNAVIFDELTSLNCVSSGMFRETLSVGGILVRSYSAILTKSGHGADDCPVLHAESMQSVYKRMKELMVWDSDEIQQWKSKVHCWANKHLNYHIQIQRLVDHLEEVVYAHNVSKKLKSWYE